MQFLWLDGGPLSVEFIELAALTTAVDDVFTFPVSFGAPASSRKIIVAVHAAGDTDDNPNLLSATIGGVAATIFDGGMLSPASPDSGVWWIGAEVPTGTSGNLVLNFDTIKESLAVVRPAVWRLINARSLTKTGSDNQLWNLTGAAQTVNANVVGNGVQFAAASILLDGGTFSFTAGITTTNYNQSITGTSISRIIGGFSLITADEASRAVTVAKSGGAEVWRGVLVTVSHR